MATMKQLADLISEECSWITPRRAKSYADHFIARGLLPKGKAGRGGGGAALINATHAARMILAVASMEEPIDAPDAIAEADVSWLAEMLESGDIEPWHSARGHAAGIQQMTVVGEQTLSRMRALLQSKSARPQPRRICRRRPGPMASATFRDASHCFVGDGGSVI